VLLTEIELVGFKAYERAAIRVAPVTVLIGPNNGGKSTVLQALGLLAQTVAASQGAIKTQGPIVDLGSSTAELANDSTGRAASWGINLTWSTPADGEPVDVGFELKVGPEQRPQPFATTTWVTQKRSGRLGPVDVRATSGSPKVTVKATGLPQQGIDVPANAASPWQWQIAGPSGGTGPLADQLIAEILATATPLFAGAVAHQLEAFHYVGPDRQVVRSAFPLGGSRIWNPQKAEDVINTFTFEDEILARVSDRLRRTFHYGLDKTLFRADQFGTANRGNQVALVGTTQDGHRRNIVNMGAGFTQFGWIALQVELARRFQDPQYGQYAPRIKPTPIVGVEEPELHLHPRLQPAMAELLADFTLQGAQVVCTTQSEHFLMAILELILAGKLTSDQVSVYYLDAPVVERLEVDSKGQLKGGLRGFLEENEKQVERQIELLRKSAGLDP